MTNLAPQLSTGSVSKLPAALEINNICIIITFSNFEVKNNIFIIIIIIIINAIINNNIIIIIFRSQTDTIINNIISNNNLLFIPTWFKL